MAEQPESGDNRFPPGAQIWVRDEAWLVKNAVRTDHDGYKIDAVGISELVRDEPAVFFSGIDTVQTLEPEDTRLVADSSPHFRRSRLYLEAVLRKTPLPQSERGLALPDRFLVDPLTYQQRPAELALSMENLRPRILIADVVGLGKTLEIGLTLAELIRRGRGERLLVVTPEHILEQFQRELWTRFSIPLVRLDSLGIQRIQRDIPAGRNPFTYYKRVIISVDTLKNIGQYRHHLERIHWDAVVIDESHNLINPGSQRRALAETLAPNTDALLLASATPHNGDRASFADLISLLDPTTIADPNTYDPEKDLRHLFIRRTKISPEVRDQVGTEWADRGPTDSRYCPATAAEERIFKELTGHWIPEAAAADSIEFGTADEDRQSVTRDRLFAYQLLKSFLSSHMALGETVRARQTSLRKKAAQLRERGRDGDAEALAPERQALDRLGALVASMGDGSAPGDAAKLDALVDKLKEIGVGPRSSTRAVIFSERIPTLKWLAEVVPARLGFTKHEPGRPYVDQDERRRPVRILHGGLSDQEQQKTVRAFELAEDPVRLLFTGDIASEGVNFHHQCHDLIHFDIPWSLVRIEQRNGRIDRYGQRHQPRFCALLITSQVPGARDDRAVAEKVLRREEEAYLVHGSVEGETGFYRAEREEERLTRDLIAGKTVEEHYAQAPAAEDPFADLFGQFDTRVVPGGGHEPPRRARVPSLFGGDTAAFVDAALAEVYDDRPGESVGLTRDTDPLGGDYLSLAPAKAPDLRQRLKALPDDYLKEQGVAERLTLTFDRALASRKLTEARDSSTTNWPRVSYVTDIHPVVEWLTDKVLVRFGRQEAPVLTSPHVDGPVFLLQGLYANGLGRPTVVEWIAVSGLPADGRVEPMEEALAAAGVGPGMTATGRPRDLPSLQELVPAAVAVAREHLVVRRDAWAERIREPLDAYRDRLKEWHQYALPTGSPARKERQVESTRRGQARLVDQLETTGDPLIRVLAVLDRP
ncbi:SNF2-related protein [Streptomyces gobiensis]|uniref:SNF2-related protein n=1 Tax=Streptomyces gobiensis TaxID=2875706 RepID=UPI001E3EA891|nr:SNF2-related protein [Streptomyces gobiensis]UGY90770.1 DEAD/DEAH box helicase [Streptomyces gobiensis]